MFNIPQITKNLHLNQSLDKKAFVGILRALRFGTDDRDVSFLSYSEYRLRGAGLIFGLEDTILDDLWGLWKKMPKKYRIEEVKRLATSRYNDENVDFTDPDALLKEIFENGYYSFDKVYLSLTEADATVFNTRWAGYFEMEKM